MAVYVEPREVFVERLRCKVVELNAELEASGHAPLSEDEIAKLVDDMELAWNMTLAYPESSDEDNATNEQVASRQIGQILLDEREQGVAKSLYGRRVSDKPLHMDVFLETAINTAFEQIAPTDGESFSFEKLTRDVLKNFVFAILNAREHTKELDGELLCIAYTGAQLSIGHRPNPVTPIFNQQEPQPFSIDDFCEALPVNWINNTNVPCCTESRAPSWKCTFLRHDGVCHLELKRNTDFKWWQEKMKKLLCLLSTKYPVFEKRDDGTYVYRK